MLLVGPGHGGDSPMLPKLLEALWILGLGAGRPRTRPESVCLDKAYSARSHRELLRRRGIRAVIPERADQIVNRQRRGSTGGRLTSCDPDAYRNRNVVERWSCATRTSAAR